MRNTEVVSISRTDSCIVSSNGIGSVSPGLWTEVKERVDYREEGNRKGSRNVGPRPQGSFEKVGKSP